MERNRESGETFVRKFKIEWYRGKWGVLFFFWLLSLKLNCLICWAILIITNRMWYFFLKLWIHLTATPLDYERLLQKSNPSMAHTLLEVTCSLNGLKPLTETWRKHIFSLNQSVPKISTELFMGYCACLLLFLLVYILFSDIFLTLRKFIKLIFSEKRKSIHKQGLFKWIGST